MEFYKDKQVPMEVVSGGDPDTNEFILLNNVKDPEENLSSLNTHEQYWKFYEAAEKSSTGTAILLNTIVREKIEIDNKIKKVEENYLQKEKVNKSLISKAEKTIEEQTLKIKQLEERIKNGISENSLSLGNMLKDHTKERKELEYICKIQREVIIENENKIKKLHLSFQESQSHNDKVPKTLPDSELRKENQKLQNENKELHYHSKYLQQLKETTDKKIKEVEEIYFEKEKQLKVSTVNAEKIIEEHKLKINQLEERIKTGITDQYLFLSNILNDNIKEKKELQEICKIQREVILENENNIKKLQLSLQESKTLNDLNLAKNVQEQELTKQNQRLQNENNELHSNFDSLQLEVQELKKENEILKEELSQQETNFKLDIKKLEEEVEKKDVALKKFNILKAKCRITKEIHVKNNVEKNGLRNELQKVNIQMITKNNDISLLTGQLQEITDKHIAVSKELKKSNTVVKRLKTLVKKRCKNQLQD